MRPGECNHCPNAVYPQRNRRLGRGLPPDPPRPQPAIRLAGSVAIAGQMVVYTVDYPLDYGKQAQLDTIGLVTDLPYSDDAAAEEWICRNRIYKTLSQVYAAIYRKSIHQVNPASPELKLCLHCADGLERRRDIMLEDPDGYGAKCVQNGNLSGFRSTVFPR